MQCEPFHIVVLIKYWFLWNAALVHELVSTCAYAWTCYSFTWTYAYVVSGIFFMMLGIVMFIPGFYYTRIAYYAYKGYKGFSFSNIPPIWRGMRFSFSNIPPIWRGMLSAGYEVVSLVKSSSTHPCSTSFVSILFEHCRMNWWMCTDKCSHSCAPLRFGRLEGGCCVSVTMFNWYTLLLVNYVVFVRDLNHSVRIKFSLFQLWRHNASS
jgi:hypothetical protein